MDSSGRVWEFVETPEGTKGVPPGPILVTGEAMPAACRPRQVLKAMEDLSAIEGEVSIKSPALAPLTPFECGWILGVRAARASVALNVETRRAGEPPDCADCDGAGGRQVGTGYPDANGDEEWEIESCAACEGTGRAPRSESNARLIAAAPDLLAALWNFYREGRDYSDETWAAMKRAIYKAEEPIP